MLFIVEEVFFRVRYFDYSKRTRSIVVRKQRRRRVSTVGLVLLDAEVIPFPL